jgi:hypothetical protein
VLVLNLSGATTEAQFVNYFRKWKKDIQENPQLWNDDGWSLESVRLKFQEFLDSTGTQLLSFRTGDNAK